MNTQAHKTSARRTDEAPGPAGPPPAFHVMAKPMGPLCNLACRYCFYQEKTALFPEQERYRMPDDVLESFVRQYIESQQTPEVSFAWQGGEPTLAGVDFFRRVVALQRKYAGGKTISNSFQTNAILLDDEWGGFLAEHRFLIGVSIDGPRELHDAFRQDRNGAGTFDGVLKGLDVLKKHRVDFNTLTVVNRRNARQPLAVYNFLKNLGSTFLQFIPIVERRPAAGDTGLGLRLGSPPEPGAHFPAVAQTMPWCVGANDYGAFLCRIFDEWVRKDVGNVFVQHFDCALAIWMGLPASVCIFSPQCGTGMALEHNGDLYACDHYVYPAYKLGNIMETDVGILAGSPQQRAFGRAKETRLPKFCRDCPVRFACHGECPKHRFLRAPDGEEGLNYLCAGYKKFFTHIDPHLRTMAQLLREQRPPSDIMAMLK